MRPGQNVRDNLTGIRGVVVKTDRYGVTVNRSPLTGTADLRTYAWREAYRTFAGTHRRLEVV